MPEAGHALSQKLLNDLQQLLFALGDLVSIVDGGTGALYRQFT